MAEGGRVWSGVERVEFFPPGEGHHEAGQEKEAPDAFNLQFDSRYRFRRSNGAQRDSAAEGRCGSALRPVHLHRVRARCRPWYGSEVDARALRVCGETNRRILLPRPTRRGHEAADERPKRLQVLRVRDGPGAE